jgi:hypothetical protein
MASPAPDCTCGEPEKAKVWPNSDSGGGRLMPAGKVTGAVDLQSAELQISSVLAKIVFLF